MSDRSDELTTTREPASTDELLEETERLLSGDSGGGEASESPSTPEAGETSFDTDAVDESAASAGTETSTDTEGSLRSRLSPTTHFSPKAFLALVLTMGAGMVLAGTFLPFSSIASVLGVLATAFGIGLLTSKRRYFEMTIAGAIVGLLAALANFAILIPVGSGEILIAAGLAVGILSSVVGYYFGRDLRDGLVRDLE